MTSQPGLYQDVRPLLLEARERRQLAIDRLLLRGNPVVSVGLAIPGAVKRPAGCTTLFHRGLNDMLASVPAIEAVVRLDDPLGPFAAYPTGRNALEAKAAAIAIEARIPVFRLLDIDVYCVERGQVSRTEFGLPPRSCLICREPATECMRTSRHEPSDLATQAIRLLRNI